MRSSHLKRRNLTQGKKDAHSMLTHLGNASHTECRGHGYLDEVRLTSGASTVVKESLQYDRIFSLTLQEGTLLESKNGTGCLHRMS